MQSMQTIKQEPYDVSLELLISALDAAQDGIFIYDKDLRVLYANNSALELCGLKIEQTIGKTWQLLEKEGYFYGHAAVNCLQTQKRVSAEYTSIIGRYLSSTATPVFDKTGQLTHVITNVRDLTNIFDLQQKLITRRNEIDSIKKKLDDLTMSNGNTFVYDSPYMSKIIATLERVAPTDISVLLLGESGVGKSHLAEFIHSKSSRASQQPVVINCGAIPPTLCEAEFFGYEKGAFTGATSSKIGIFESANHSTLVLDEVGELPIFMQVKLLRALQDGKIKRIGSNKEINIDVRIIAVTNKNLKDMVEKGTFREDLYHRLNVIHITIPPLRDRPDDIKKLLSYFLNIYNIKYNMKKTLSPALIDVLEHYSWPGNTREMANLFERIVVLSDGNEIDCEYLPEEIHNIKTSNVEIVPLKDAVEKTEKDLLTVARKKYGNTRKIAGVLEVSHVTVARKLKQYGIM